MRAVKRRDPAPSKTGFRLRRLWRSRAFRRVVTLWIPCAAILGAGVWAASQPHLRALAMERYAELRHQFVQRPEFAIRRVVVSGASPLLEAELRAALGPALGASSLEIDARAVRAHAEALGWVAAARVRLEAPETLHLHIRERTPDLLWRRGEDLILLDRDGAEIDRAAARADWPELPVVAGTGANDPLAVDEALAIFAAAGGLAPRLRGLVRVGERRWNAVIQDGPTILLPETGAADAIGYAAALDEAEDLLARDVAQVDLRLSRRPTLRLGPDAVDSLAASRAPKAPGEDA